MPAKLEVGGLQGYSQSLTDTNLVSIDENTKVYTPKLKVNHLSTNTFHLTNDHYTISANNELVFNDSNTRISNITVNNYQSSGFSIQKKMRMIRKKFMYSTGGGYSQNFAHASCFRTKITSRKNNSAFIVKMGLNGEGGSTHDWVMYPVRGFIDTDTMNITDWNHNIARHLNNGENPNSTYEYYCFGYTNMGAYSNVINDYNITPIQTATLEFIDTPNVPAGTDIWYSLVFMSSGDHEFYVNSVADTGWRYSYTSAPYYGYFISTSTSIGTGVTTTVYSLTWDSVNLYFSNTPITFPYTTGGFTYYIGNLRDSGSSYSRYEILRTPEGEPFSASITGEYQASTSYVYIEEIDSHNMTTPDAWNSSSSGIYEYRFS